MHKITNTHNKHHAIAIDSSLNRNQQGVTLTGRNTTGLPSRAAPGELRCVCAAVECHRRRRRQRAKQYWPSTLCVGGPVINEWNRLGIYKISYV